MAKARRKMRRALMKKMKKGSLTPGERRDLMDLDREVNKANRQAAGAAGAGLGAALAIASKTGALDRAGDSLGAFLDSRAEVRGERRAERADAQEEKERERDEAELSRRAAAAERSAEMEEERELEDPYLEAVRNVDDSVAVGPANKNQGVQARRQAALAERRARKDAERENEDNLRDLDPALRANRLQNKGAETSDDLVIDRDLYSRDQRRQMRRSGFNPETGEYLPTSAELERDEQDQREFDESISDAEVMEAGRQLNLELQEDARRHGFDSLDAMNDFYRDFYAEGEKDMAEAERERVAQPQSNVDYNADPRVDRMIRLGGTSQATGGYTPFLASMRQKLRKRFR